VPGCSGDMRNGITRRSLLTALAAGAGGLLLPDAVVAARPVSRALRRDPFTLGIASGDPTGTGVVLWTRLAPDPTAPDGLGGMPAHDVEVGWQLAADERFSKVVASGTAVARRETAHSVHVEVDGLEPGREYFYRFRAGGHISPAGRTRTAPAGVSPLTFAMASCAHWEHGYYTAYRRIAELEPDLVVHLGDYIYEYRPLGYRAPGGAVREHVGGKCRTLADYRIRHAQYKTDPDLQAAHLAAPWLVAFDDHEVENNWAGPESSLGTPDFLARRARAFRAYYEHMPLRRSRQRGTSIRIHRRVHWGELASFHLLDTRRFRDDQACGDGERAGCHDRLDPGRTILGADQRRWLLDGLARSRARWNFIAQQVLMAQRDAMTGPGTRFNMDGWDGYAAERARLLHRIKEVGVANPVVLTGDAHMHHAAELRPDFADPDSPRVAVELVTSSVSSDGDGYHDDARVAALLRENPHIAYLDERRGFVVCRVTAEEMTVDFRTLGYVSRRGAPARTTARFTVRSGHPQLIA